jgi:hypothetical protein
MARRAPTEQQVKDAVAVLTRDYYSDVEGVVNELESQIKDGTIRTREQADEWIHETVDGHQRVIYTWQAKMGLLVSENEDAMAEELGESDVSPDPSVRMYWAMKKDVEEAVEGSSIIERLED